MSKNYKFPAWRCRSDRAFQEAYYSDIRTFYRYTDGIFNTKFMGRIFTSSSQYIRKVLLQDEKCVEILNKRRYRGRVHTRPRKQLVGMVLDAWKADNNIFIDDLALKFNIAVISVQTILNRRPDASEEEYSLQRPLSFRDCEDFYQRNGWKNAEGEWTKSDKVLGWALNPDEIKKLRTFNEYPWPDSNLDPKVVADFFMDCEDMKLTMARFNIVSEDQFRTILEKGLSD